MLDVARVIQIMHINHHDAHICVGCGAECWDCSGARSYGPFSFHLSQMPDVDRIFACSDDRRPIGSSGSTARRHARQSTVGTLNMGTWAGTGEALAWNIDTVMPPLKYLRVDWPDYRRLEGRGPAPQHRRLLRKAHLPFRGPWPRASPRATKPGRGSTRTVNS